MPTKTEAIKNFLNDHPISSLSGLYSANMEVQVNVAQDGGERVEESFKGRQWHGWTDGAQTWKSFRIPYKAKSEPEYTDTQMSFNLADHVEGIGLTGWDWKNLVSRWVAFDFDSITNHKEALTDEQLKEIVQKVENIPWVSAFKSTSGKGIHLYIFLKAVPCKNHTEHAALARSILGLMSATAGYDFSSKVDICGGNMWIWHRKAQRSDGEGLKLIKQGGKLDEVPPNWRDHVKVITGAKRRALPQDIGDESKIEATASQYTHTPLDSDHKRLIEWLKSNNAMWWWSQDQHMLVTHTYHLKEAFIDLGFKGVYDTISTGKEKGVDYNCFCFPQRQGAWAVRRFTAGVQEHETWEQDGSGWTRCYYNQEPSLHVASRMFAGKELPKGGFQFDDAEAAQKTAHALGSPWDNLPAWASARSTVIREHKDGRRIVVEVERQSKDNANEMQGWVCVKDKTWQRIFNANINPITESDLGNFDDLIRHMITEQQEDYGWALCAEGRWRVEPLMHIKAALESMGFDPKECKEIVGKSVFKCWEVVNIPFVDEYPGNRKWNRSSAQLRFKPSQAENPKFETWLQVLNHCGASMDSAIKNMPWCANNGLVTGGDYLKCWIAALFQQPIEPLPYLFFYGPQNSGKSIFHEALQLLISNGVVRADNALISPSGFNGELAGAVLCVIEETDLQNNKVAYNRIKDWVTSRTLSIHEKGQTPYHIPNTTHWVQAANDHYACPIFAGDTRITAIFVPELDPIDLIPKRDLLYRLEQEAGDFLTEILSLEIPPSGDRLAIPVVTTNEKLSMERVNRSPLLSWLEECCFECPGNLITFAEVYNRFRDWLDVADRPKYTKIAFGRELPPKFPKGRVRGQAAEFIANLSFDKDTRPIGAYALKANGYLEPA